MEFRREKNKATVITFPILDSLGDPLPGATSPDSEITGFSDGAAPSSFADCTNEISEIDSEGIYSLSLTAGETNNDYNYIQVKSSGKTQHLIINTKGRSAEISISGMVDVTQDQLITVSGYTDTLEAAIYAFQKNTAFSNFPFPMITASGVLVTGATVTTELTKDGASFGASDNSATEIGSGWYGIDFSADDLNADAVGFKATGTGGSQIPNPTNFTIKTQP